MSKFGNTSSRFVRFAAGVSQLLNVILFNGNPSETISSRSYRRGVLEESYRWFIMSKIIDTIFFWETNHCKESYKLCFLFAASFIEQNKLNDK